MSSSPFCPRCLEYGDLRHTYKIAGKPSFKCGTCKQVHPLGYFQLSDFSWKDDFEGWKKSMASSLSKKGGNIKDELKRLEKVSNGS